MMIDISLVDPPKRIFILLYYLLKDTLMHTRSLYHTPRIVQFSIFRLLLTLKMLQSKPEDIFQNLSIGKSERKQQQLLSGCKLLLKSVLRAPPNRYLLLAVLYSELYELTFLQSVTHLN